MSGRGWATNSNAERRTCPECGRKAAMIKYDDVIRICKWWREDKCSNGPAAAMERSNAARAKVGLGPRYLPAAIRAVSATCTVDGCAEPAALDPLCAKHYVQLRPGRETCEQRR